MINAPFTDEQIASLNAFQKDQRFHPFTCPGEGVGCGDNRELVATRDGWVCRCGRYTQTWAHEFMATWPVG